MTLISSRCSCFPRAVAFIGRAVPRRTSLLLVAIALTMHPSIAAAMEMAVAIDIEGTDAGTLREALIGALPENARIAETATFHTAMAESGQAGPFGAGLDGKARDEIVARVARAAASSNLEGAFVGRVSREKGKRHIVLLWVEKDGSVVDLGEALTGHTKSKADTKVTLASLVHGVIESQSQNTKVDGPKPAVEASALAVRQPAVSQREQDTAEARPEPEASPGPELAASPHPRGLISRSLLGVEIGTEAAGRQFDYTDGFTSNLRSYSVFPAAQVVVAGEVFPWADGGGVLGDFGIVADYSQSLFLQSAVPGSGSLATSMTAYSVGGRVRIHPMGETGPVFGLSDAYAMQSFGFDSPKAPIDSQAPAVSYSANRIAADARIPIGRFAILGGAGFRGVLDAGAVAKRFSHSSTSGVDAQIGGALSVSTGWELRLVADYERYFYSFKPQAGDAYVAGGALDQFFGGRMAIAYIY